MKKIKEYYFITGASKGIGKAFLELLIKNGCFVLVLVRNKKDMMQYKNNKNVIIFEGDICNNNIIKKVFDYVDKTPEQDEIISFLKAKDKYQIPIKAGGWFYTVGEHKNLLKKNLLTAQNLGSTVHNTQIQAINSDGNLVTNSEVRDV